MSNEIRIRAAHRQGITDLRVLIRHPMETGNRKDSGGRNIPEHFIRTVTLRLNGVLLTRLHWGPGVSRDPLFGMRLQQARPGDRIEVLWIDNLGNQGSETAVVAEQK